MKPRKPRRKVFRSIDAFESYIGQEGNYFQEMPNGRIREDNCGMWTYWKVQETRDAIVMTEMETVAQEEA